jgi:hypothetical protein
MHVKIDVMKREGKNFNFLAQSKQGLELWIDRSPSYWAWCHRVVSDE